MPEFGTPSLSPHAAIQKSQKKTGPEIFEIYLKRDNKLQMDDFGDVYSEQEILKDKNLLERMASNENYDRSDVQGTVLENIIVDIGEQNMWFGDEENYLIQLSEYDDKAPNGAHADAVLEIKTKDGNIMRLGIDFTLSANSSLLNKKRAKCLDLIDSGKLANVKYFQSELTNEKGRLADIPIVMAGVDRETLHKLCKDVAKKENLTANPAQYMILDEILYQLDIFVAISASKHGMQNELTQELEAYREIFIEILKKKESLRPDNFREKALQDGVYSYLTN